ncbi:MAG: hypothetical protein ACRDTD_03120 [Pseudonocardiaceae bacterium]
MLWRRLPRAVRTRSQWAAPFNVGALRAGARPLAETRMRAGHRMLLDLRSGSEWFAFYTGEFDDSRIPAARHLLTEPGSVSSRRTEKATRTVFSPERRGPSPVAVQARVALQAAANTAALRSLAADPRLIALPKRVEPRLIDQLASALLADADRFTRSRVIAPRLAPTTDRQSIPADPFVWEVTEHEEALSRLWAAIYALRAELLAVERLISFGVDRQQVIQQAVTAAWRWALASTEATSYAAAFGADAIGGGVSAHDLVALAGWTPPLSSEQQSRLQAAAARGADHDRFVAAAHADTELGHAWTDAFLASAGPGSPKNYPANDTTRQAS